MNAALLIADADRDLLDLHRRFFTDRDFPVETASTGLDCLVKLPRFQPQVLILDVNLPHGGADCVLARLHADRMTQPAPAVVLTGDGPPRSVTRIIITSPVVMAYFQKPFHPCALLAAVRSAAVVARAHANAIDRIAQLATTRTRIDGDTSEAHSLNGVRMDGLATTKTATGIGISPEALPQVFDLFWQSSRAADHSERGLGLGLALVRKQVEMHGGSVAAHSAGPGQGSEFVVRLPVAGCSHGH